MYFLNIYKPKGITSFDCIKILRKKLGIKAIGHSGTLDPLASGVMQIGVGKATKLLDYLPDDKTYIASLKFGFESSTMDEEGEKTFVAIPCFDKSQFIQTFNSFLGKIRQIPPKYSAIKQNGKKLCDIVRKNPDIELSIKPRNIEIYDISLLDFDHDTAKIKVHCSKGTYIRSLVNDIGKSLKCGAYLSDLIRVQAGNFIIDNSQELDSADFIKINPLDVVNLEKLDINDCEYMLVKNGCAIETHKKFKNNTIMLTNNKKLVSIANLSDNPNKCNCFLVKPKKNFCED